MPKIGAAAGAAAGALTGYFGHYIIANNFRKDEMDDLAQKLPVQTVKLFLKDPVSIRSTKKYST